MFYSYLEKSGEYHDPDQKNLSFIYKYISSTKYKNNYRHQ